MRDDTLIVYPGGEPMSLEYIERKLSQIPSKTHQDYVFALIREVRALRDRLALTDDWSGLSGGM